ncbi:glycerol 3-phosphate dehydrogenase (NAD(P)+) [Natranaerovirga hydrolytica]|uniref:Glycerol-3-phosphate dehydrogenase [NAD(P)+] n=1 Tax=Natranaerovirga hydrolytica TaxID=680378 RepID=A0A4R1N0B3_9FIRM|nr:NAD(P)H-dependent glycerol-3-phosphate dehydrogenase [Natranaerovirga hydrolytica]TCK98292.1 glycerol 3-phosphate dehydrogenase (NAD(P)+) [Natranaerovirga hydrolytica]
MERISIIGAGSWGTALGILLAKSGHQVKIWSILKDEIKMLNEEREHKDKLPGIAIPSNIYGTTDLKEAMEDTKIVVMAVPSKFVRETSKKVKEFIQKDQIIVNVAKGLEESTLLSLAEVIEEEMPDNEVAVLSGPSHAEEVAKDIPTTCVVGANSKSVANKVQDVFMSKTFRVYTSPDIKGIELGGALKNVIALAAGISDGLNFGDNTKAALMTRGIAELSRLGIAMGASVHTFAGLSGIGDLIVTCTSMHSRNRRAGILIGQGQTLEEAIKEVNMVVEGVNTAKAAYEISKKYAIEMPIIEQIYKVLFENKNPKEAVEDLMLRDKTNEHKKLDMDFNKTIEWYKE